MTTPFVANSGIAFQMSSGYVSTQHVIKAALIASSNPNAWAGSNIDFGLNPSLSTVTLNISNDGAIGYNWITCAPFTFTAVSAIGPFATIIIYDNSNNRILGTMTTGSVTNLAAGESLTVNFDDALYTNGMLKFTNV